MPSSRTKRSSRHISDSDDSSDDELLASAFSMSRTSKRKNTRDAEAQKKKRLEQMNALLDNGRVKLEVESRIDDIHQENKELLQWEDTDKKETKEEKNDEKKIVTPHSETIDEAEDEVKNTTKELYDTKVSFCLGSRKTLQTSRFVSCRKTSDGSSGVAASEGITNDVVPMWSSFEDALADFRTLLLIDEQQHKQSTSFATLREALLRSRVTTSPHFCRTYLQKMIMCTQEDPEQTRRVPIDVLRWLMSMACSPTVDGGIADSKNSNKMTETTSKKDSRDESKRRTRKASKKENTSSKVPDQTSSLRFWKEAHVGAFKTLHRLWSQQSGFPLQESQEEEIYLLSVSTLTHQLHQWFGSTLPLKSVGRLNEKNDTTEDQNNRSLSDASQSAVPATQSNDDSKKDPVLFMNDRTSLVRFLQLWALALQKQNTSTGTEGDVNLVDFGCAEDNREKFRNDISDAIIAVLWAELDPIFASCESGKDDCHGSIQTVVRCLLESVRWEARVSKTQVDHDADGIESSYENWVSRLSEQICEIWSKKLGRGEAGTDAYDDDQAWICLARTLACLDQIDDSFEQGGIGESYSDQNAGNGGETGAVSSIKFFQLSLARCILRRAFYVNQLGDRQTLNLKEIQEKVNPETSNSDEWLSRLIDDEIRILNIPEGMRSSYSWQAMILSCIGLDQLASTSPEHEACKMFAVANICLVCFRFGVKELQRVVERRCSKKREEEGFGEHEKGQTTKDTASTSASIEHNPIDSKSLEKLALYNTFEQVEIRSQILSNKCRGLLFQSSCFGFSSNIAEDMRNYARLNKEPLAPKDSSSSVKQQAKISAFFMNGKPSQE